MLLLFFESVKKILKQFYDVFTNNDFKISPLNATSNPTMAKSSV